MIYHSITNFSSKGGAEAFLSRLCNSELFSSIDNKVVSVCEISNDNKKMISSERVEYEALGATSMLGMLLSAIKMAKLIRADQPTAIFAWMYHAHVITTLAVWISRYKGPVFWCVRHSLDDFKSESTSTKVAILCCRLLSRFSSSIIYCSKRAMRQHQAFGFCKSSNQFLANGYEIPLYKQRSLPDIKRIGIAGRFHPAKNYPGFLSAAKLLLEVRQDVEFVLCGRGVTLGNPAFKSLVDSLNLPLEYFQFKDEMHDMDEFYKGIDFFVLSSITEGFPNVLAEAMSHGIPSTSTDVGDAAYILSNMGQVVPCNRPDLLAEEMQRLLSLSNERYAELSQGCARRVETEFSIEHVTQGYFEMVREYT